MKYFYQFSESIAAQQAARMGLQGDGHGGWYDRASGEFVAKTEKGKLKFYNKRQRVGQQDPAQTEKEKNISDPNLTIKQISMSRESPDFVVNLRCTNISISQCWDPLSIELAD